MSRVLKTIRVIFFILGFTISILTTAMSYDAARIGVDALGTNQSAQIVEDGETTTATLRVNIKNNGYIFSFNDVNLKITTYDTQHPEKPLGTGTKTFTVGPGEEFSDDIRIPMRTSEYQSAANINVTVTLDAGLALNLPSSRITFVSFTLTSSEVTPK